MEAEEVTLLLREWSSLLFLSWKLRICKNMHIGIEIIMTRTKKTSETQKWLKWQFLGLRGTKIDNEMHFKVY